MNHIVVFFQLAIILVKILYSYKPIFCITIFTYALHEIPKEWFIVKRPLHNINQFLRDFGFWLDKNDIVFVVDIWSYVLDTNGMFSNREVLAILQCFAHLLESRMVYLEVVDNAIIWINFSVDNTKALVQCFFPTLNLLW